MIMEENATDDDDVDVETIPHEIIYNILIRLPVKSLTRFRSASTLWNSTISNRSFAQSHLCRSLLNRSNGATTTTLLLTFTQRFNAKRLIFSVKIPANRNHSNPPTHHLTITGYANPYVSQSLQGLICLNLGSLCVCNPSTRKFVKLPWTEVETPSLPAFGHHRTNSFGFDPVRNEHKVLDTWIICTDTDLIMEHRVFTVGTNNWRRIGDGLPHFPFNESVCINGYIYYRGCTSMINSEDTILVAFDVGSEIFSFIKMPDDIGEESDLIEYEGHLAIVDYQGLRNGNNNLLIWVQEVEQKQGWAKNSIELSVNCTQIKKIDNFHFAGTTFTGELIFAPRSLVRPFYVFFYGIKSNSLRKVEICELPEFDCNAFASISITDHIETILSVT